MERQPKNRLDSSKTDPWDLYFKVQDGFRKDIRVYATSLLQLVMLIVTSCTLIVGWAVKDFLAIEYDTAKCLAGPPPVVGKTSPSIMAVQQAHLAKQKSVRNAADGSGAAAQHAVSVPSGEKVSEKKKSTERRDSREATWLRGVHEVFWARIRRSPITAIFLCILSMAVSTITATICVTGYVIAARRHASHDMLAQIRKHFRLPIPHKHNISDSLLTSAAIAMLAFFIFGASTVLTGSAVLVYIRAVHGTPTWLTVLLTSLILGACCKYAESAYLGYLFARWDYQQHPSSGLMSILDARRNREKK